MEKDQSQVQSKDEEDKEHKDNQPKRLTIDGKSPELDSKLIKQDNEIVSTLQT